MQVSPKLSSSHQSLSLSSSLHLFLPHSLTHSLPAKNIVWESDIFCIIIHDCALYHLPWWINGEAVLFLTQAFNNIEIAKQLRKMVNFSALLCVKQLSTIVPCQIVKMWKLEPTFGEFILELLKRLAFNLSGRELLIWMTMNVTHLSKKYPMLKQNRELFKKEKKRIKHWAFLKIT